MKIETCNLQTFYKYTKNITVKKRIVDSVSLENIQKILEKLEIQDSKLDQMMIEPMKIYQKYREESLARAYAYYKGGI